jgi:hypothetical protein
MSKCPAICPDDNCGIHLNDTDVKQLLSKEEVEKYQELVFKRTLETQPDISWCPTVNCDFAFIFQDDNGSDFRCRKCNKHYCLNCRVLYHRGQTCREY